jgi:hypothetical protein
VPTPSPSSRSPDDVGRALPRGHRGSHPHHRRQAHGFAPHHLAIQTAMGWTHSHLYEIHARDAGWSSPLPDCPRRQRHENAEVHVRLRRRLGAHGQSRAAKTILMPRRPTPIGLLNISPRSPNTGLENPPPNALAAADLRSSHLSSPKRPARACPACRQQQPVPSSTSRIELAGAICAPGLTAASLPPPGSRRWHRPPARSPPGSRRRPVPQGALPR